MAELTEEHKTAIITGLAQFMRAADIVVMMREEFGVEIDTQQVSKYNPLRACYEGGEKWRDIFDAARKAYIEDVQTKPVANQGYRLALLQKGIEAAEKAKNWVLVASLCEQAAKEVGGVLTNERNLKVDDARRQRAADMTPEDRRLAVAEVIRQAVEHLATKGNAPGSEAVQ